MPAITRPQVTTQGAYRIVGSSVVKQESRTPPGHDSLAVRAAARSGRDQLLRMVFHQREQKRAALVARLADGGDVDGRVVFHGALVLADAAADALLRVDVRALELERRPP